MRKLIYFKLEILTLSTTWMSYTIDWEYSSSLSSYVEYETGNIYTTKGLVLTSVPKGVAGN